MSIVDDSIANGAIQFDKRIELLRNSNKHGHVKICDCSRRASRRSSLAMAPLAAAIVCVAEWERRVALHHRIGPPERLHVIHNGAPPCPGCTLGGRIGGTQ